MTAGITTAPGGSSGCRCQVPALGCDSTVWLAGRVAPARRRPTPGPRAARAGGPVLLAERHRARERRELQRGRERTRGSGSASEVPLGLSWTPGPSETLMEAVRPHCPCGGPPGTVRSWAQTVRRARGKGRMTPQMDKTPGARGGGLPAPGRRGEKESSGKWRSESQTGAGTGLGSPDGGAEQGRDPASCPPPRLCCSGPGPGPTLWGLLLVPAPSHGPSSSQTNRPLPPLQGMGTGAGQGALGDAGGRKPLSPLFSLRALWWAG